MFRASLGQRERKSDIEEEVVAGKLLNASRIRNEISEAAPTNALDSQKKKTEEKRNHGDGAISFAEVIGDAVHETSEK